MNIYIDRTTGKVTPSQSPLTYMIEVPDSFTLSKTIELQQGEKQKTNEQGQLLYKANVVKDNLGKETFEETTESRTVTKTEPKDTVIKWIDEDGKEQSKTVVVQEPIEWTDNEPIMIPNMVQKVIAFKDSPSEFTVNEIAIAKFKNILEASNCDHILADLFLNEDDIDLQDVGHKANTGIALMQLLPHGQAKTKGITLETAAKTFTLLEFIADDGVDVYINETKFINNQVVLQQATDKCTIRFVNTTDKPKLVKSYAIGY